MTKQIYFFTVIAALLLAISVTGSVTGTALARQFDSGLNAAPKGEVPTETATPTAAETTATETATTVATETASATETGVVTETATATPTAVITETPPATETVVITETPVITETATATATAIVTETTTATPTPISTVPPLTPSPVPTVPSVGAKITIIKDTQPDGADGSKFYGPFGAFTLTDDGTQTCENDSTKPCPDRITYTVPVGNYNFSEVITTSYYLSAIDCTNNGSTGDADITVNLRTRVLSVNAQNGDNVVCTYVNQRRVAITVKTYNDDNGNGAQDDGETPDDNVGIRLYHKDFANPVYNVTDASGALSFVRLKPGDYKVCALDLEQRKNTQPGTVDSETGLACYAVTLAPAEDATVVFGHTSNTDEPKPTQPAPSIATGLTIRSIPAGVTPIYQNAIDLGTIDQGTIDQGTIDQGTIDGGRAVYLPMIRR